MTIQQQFDYYVSEPGAPMPEEHFSDGGIDCGEHGDFDAEDRQDVISIDSTDAIMVGEYPQSSTHSFDWEPRQGVVSDMELPSLRDAGVTMNWFTEQLRIEQGWAKLYPHALSSIAESGIMFIMMTSAPADSWDKIKSLILVNKFLNGLVEGTHTEANETRLVCGPWPQPEFMPNIDSRGFLQPSPLEYPKANLQEIFATFFDHILWAKATDVHSFKNKSLRSTYDHIQRVYRGRALLSGTLGCHLVAPDARLNISPELLLHVPANDGADRLKPVMSLKNTQMGSTPAPFINPALLSDEPCWSNEISDARKNDMEWRTQPLHPHLRHPPSILMHTNDGPGSRDTPLNVIIGPSGVPRAPNFGNRLQPARTEIPGEKFHMAIIESHTVIDQLGTLELEDSGEEGTILKRRRMVLKTRMTLRWTKIELLDSGVKRGFQSEKTGKTGKTGKIECYEIL
ncbi:uncharacterized protein FOBCDRAFT_144717 [Fusarium oxysporum Fo47]|uniref:uncharacterized protein n=1 Tax=Fusarium oxysporum Fo47 TaxID=660027 RepID=UPI002869BBEB|nr:uncharacterized protein FOBCDRAFT_144717 [Fusarium oxysporum Fo47]QKD59661.2 hypothetical protein FOBCDRAFT_144717 [Fusarium oxysporum Fo47]